MNIIITIVGAVVISGITVIIFKRHGGVGDDDYGYQVPRTGTWGVGRGNIEDTIRDAERGVEHSLNGN